jgi:hypothetical protein
MSISSIPPSRPTPITSPDTSAPKAPDVKADADANDAGAAAPPIQAALPPGQGTRINQLV